MQPSKFLPARIRGKSFDLNHGWRMGHTGPGACQRPEDLIALGVNWIQTIVPGTVTLACGENSTKPTNCDAGDWWYQTTFTHSVASSTAGVFLRFDGLATLARVWLNGTEILFSENMFLAHRVNVESLIRDQNELSICFCSLTEAMTLRRSRPRWRTALVEQQNLRWFRTTLLGRMPGWTPPVVTVGPWGSVSLERAGSVELSEIDFQTWAEGSTGRVRIRAELLIAADATVSAARLMIGEHLQDLTVHCLNGCTVAGDYFIENVSLWMPHTHGQPVLHECEIQIRIGDEWSGTGLGAVGFKCLRIDQSDNRFRIAINEIPVFCRGACWTTADAVSLKADSKVLRAALEMARDAGVNMLRVLGTMVYESDAFYALCDELGILVWQDFMFANMDYPVTDEKFLACIRTEVWQQVNRLQTHACMAVYCGNSEVAQQAAMMGLPAENWSNEFFSNEVAGVCARMHHGIPYFPSTPWGGALPFHTAAGISHYYGVGAYRRPLADIKAAGVRFASECLGFSNIPEPETIELMLIGAEPAPHHPAWKARVPRDNGAGWDFEDIRDHYLNLLFGIDPVSLRSEDISRYYAVSRVVSGEVMLRAFAEWRRSESQCGGALVWLYRDLWPGAGWGITDSNGHPKSVYWYLKRAWASEAALITDDGLNGLGIHVINEHDTVLDAVVEIQLLQSVRNTARYVASDTVSVPARQSLSLQGDAILQNFFDTTAAYRFGPPKHDVVSVRLLRKGNGTVISEDFYFPTGHNLPMQQHANVSAEAEWQRDGLVIVKLTSDSFLQAVSISCDGFLPDDNYFHMLPGRIKSITFTATNISVNQFKAIFQAINLPEICTVRASRPNAAKIVS